VPKSQQIKSLFGIWRIDQLIDVAPTDAWQRLSCGNGAKAPRSWSLTAKGRRSTAQKARASLRLVSGRAERSARADQSSTGAMPSDQPSRWATSWAGRSVTVMNWSIGPYSRTPGTPGCGPVCEPKDDGCYMGRLVVIDGVVGGWA